MVPNLAVPIFIVEIAGRRLSGVAKQRVIDFSLEEQEKQAAEIKLTLAPQEGERLEDLARVMAPLQHNLHKLLSREISRDHNMMLLLGSMRAEERLATFLLNLSDRYRRRGYSSTEFVLRMTREEIGSYLGLKLETVSRTFSKFVEEGIVEVKQRHVRILSTEALQRLVNHQTACH